MKWIENGVTFEGTPVEFRELHGNMQPKRHRRGHSVSVMREGKLIMSFSTIQAAAAWISNETGRYISGAALGKHLSATKSNTFDLMAYETDLLPIAPNPAAINE